MPNQAIFFFVELQQKILENIFIIPKINTKTTLILTPYFFFITSCCKINIICCNVCIYVSTNIIYTTSQTYYTDVESFFI